MFVENALGQAVNYLFITELIPVKNLTYVMFAVVRFHIKEI
jgi:hypothetical protein